MAEIRFNELKIGSFLLDYDAQRSGNLEQLRFVPKGKQVVLRLMSTEHLELESRDAL